MFRSHFLSLLLAATAFAQVAAVTVGEAKQLSFMREEEKMARDLYRHFYQKYNLAIFDRIARSEQAHFDAIGQLLARYAVADPAANLPEGTFANANLQALYHQLAAKGDLSLRDALDVGVLVEKTDIADLETSLKATAKPDLKRVFQNLMAASYNHLEAFEECWQVSAQ
ncbi:MAG: DUF2202 domain-containing protein [Acidobacteria bacterium]|nr:DUF2202 domain-containing protein [Acidobacteriota bacterium]